MLAELQQKFFETFEIPKVFKTSINTGDLDLNYVEIQAPTLEKLYEEAQFDLDTPIFFSWFKRSKRWREEYPENKDRHYLELLCILNKVSDAKHGEYHTIISFDYKSLKEDIIEDCLLCREEIKEQVQAIFKE